MFALPHQLSRCKKQIQPMPQDMMTSRGEIGPQLGGAPNEKPPFHPRFPFHQRQVVRCSSPTGQVEIEHLATALSKLHVIWVEKKLRLQANHWEDIAKLLPGVGITASHVGAM